MWTLQRVSIGPDDSQIESRAKYGGVESIIARRLRGKLRSGQYEGPGSAWAFEIRGGGSTLYYSSRPRKLANTLMRLIAHPGCTGACTPHRLID